MNPLDIPELKFYPLPESPTRRAIEACELEWKEECQTIVRFAQSQGIGMPLTKDNNLPRPIFSNDSSNVFSQELQKYYMRLTEDLCSISIILIKYCSVCVLYRYFSIYSKEDDSFILKGRAYGTHSFTLPKHLFESKEIFWIHSDVIDRMNIGAMSNSAFMKMDTFDIWKSIVPFFQNSLSLYPQIETINCFGSNISKIIQIKINKKKEKKRVGNMGYLMRQLKVPHALFSFQMMEEDELLALKHWNNSQELIIEYEMFKSNTQGTKKIKAFFFSLLSFYTFFFVCVFCGVERELF
ncbi:hypothetical protein RFI_27333 [Reticulomyxa filosa]|uniref:Uncharacterized protein n=1 Tax=Reticulomyxa filosa TaxID=46433 RepID=X6MAI3_RETFI|nr:hypothetical protein RFI_27333 [Reticulomyxa filosa]|eukprot:ETO10045.1 hypothetical protein RFI_27333 [Reticulomyxa filosa]